MTVRVRMFAAVREAAGTGETTVAPGPLDVVLAALRERYGQEFARRLAISTVLVDGQATPQNAKRIVPDGAELAVLPPVSGGSGPSRPPGAGRPAAVGAPAAAGAVRAIASGVVAIAAVAALVAGPGPFGAVVTAVAAVLVLDLSGVLARTGARPVILAAAVPGIGLPAAIAFRPGIGWDDIPAFFATALAAASVLVLIFGRRHGVTAGIGATLVVSLVVGLGSSGLLLLSLLEDGFRWALGFLLLAAAAQAGGFLGHRLIEGRARARGVEGAGRPLGSLVAVAVAAAVLPAVLNPPFTPAAAALLAGVAFVAALGVEDLHRALATEAGTVGRPRRLLGHGLLVGSAGAVLLAAPAAYILARGLGL